MKWTILQLITASLIFINMWSIEYLSKTRNHLPSTGEWTATNSSNTTFFIIVLVITCFFLIFIFESKKRNSFFEHSVWNIIPKLCGIVGVLSIILFLLGGTMGPIMIWVEQWRSLIYVFLVYFLFLLFLFMFSFEHKRKRFEQKTEKTLVISYMWTLVLFFTVFFLL
ncbi:hypothetical protein ACERII_11690 [Evansella sp. AB-rgal1]|uniref:hypothetical protein n=1 Tax=Evansella sp. AB-rgal1 TaxID=3242696 RepID=UPI00359E24F7